MIEFLVGAAFGASLWFIPALFIMYSISKSLRGLVCKVSRIGESLGPLLGNAGISSIIGQMFRPPRGPVV